MCLPFVHPKFLFMFSIHTQFENGFDTIILTDKTTGTEAAIVPACGAILHRFSIHNGSKLQNVIDNYESIDAFTSSVESMGFKGCKLSPFPCRLKNASYRFNDRNYQIEKFVTNGHALHGIIYDVAFELQARESNAEYARIVLQHQYTGTDAGFPFSYQCRVIYQLNKVNQLSISTIIKNTGNQPMPIADGWHPYFALGGRVDDWQMQFNCKETLEFDGELLPTGKRLPYDAYVNLKAIGSINLDNSFVADAQMPGPLLTLYNPKNNLQLQIDADASYPILQIYIPPHRQSIAIENLSAAPDAFNNKIGLKELAPAAETAFSCSYQLCIR